MKEASGELSMTAVAVVAIAAVGVIFTTLIWPGIKKSLAHNTACASAYGCNCDGSKCDCKVVIADGQSCGDVGATIDSGSVCNITCSDATRKTNTGANTGTNTNPNP